MGSKKRAKKAEAQATDLKKSLASARGELSKSETKLEKSKAKAARWKEEAAAQRESAERSATQVKQLEKNLDQASAALGADAGPSGEVVKTTSSDAPVPDDSWTVVQLRAEARARGLTGISNTPKSQLLGLLS